MGRKNGPGVGDDDKDEDTVAAGGSSGSFDFDLVAQQLVTTATGSQESKLKLVYIIDTFVRCRCYEWAFVLAVVLQDYGVLADVMRRMRDATLPNEINKSLRRGLEQLDDWAQNEWYSKLFSYFFKILVYLFFI